MTADTPIVLASVSKPITATAVMQLVERGRVQLDAPVQRYLPEFRLDDPTASATITVRQLLTHTSGLPATACEHTAASLEAFVSWLRSVKPANRPGRHYEYCSGNYNVLGLLVQRVSGQPFGDYVHDHVFVPLGMSHSYSTQAAARAAGPVAQGHRWVFGLLRPMNHDNPAGLPSGYLLSTARDMSRFALALLQGGVLDGHRVLSAATVRMMQRATVDAGDGTSYGLGWQQGRIGGVPVVYHLGANYDVETMLAMQPRFGRAVVLLINAQGLLATTTFRSIEAGLVRLTSGETPDQPGMSVPTLYGIVDAVLVALSALVLLPLLRLPRWARITAPVRAERRRGGRVAARVTAEIVVPLVTLAAGTVLVVQPLGATWHQMFLLVPDFVAWLWVAAAVTVGTGVARAITATRAWRQLVESGGRADASVDGDDRTGDVGASPARQVDGNTGHVFRRPDATQR
jgi:CubicO group peptidase (beta-lactamase class C family)